MKLENLVDLLKNNGVVGAGGAGFPSYAKLDKRADTIILNCAECEPLLKLHRQVLQKYPYEILTALNIIADAVEAESIIIAIKKSYKETIEALNEELPSFKKASIGILPEAYPSGDEVVTIYETTGRVVDPGALPISVGVTVFNVETMLNAYMAITNNVPVTEKYITVAGEVNKPTTLKVPLGMMFGEIVEKYAGGVTREDVMYFSGGPMTGRVTNKFDVVTKTSNAILILPKDNFVITKRLSRVSIDIRKAMSSCCQCRICTDLCPRNLLGHQIQPHLFMRSVSSGNTDNVQPLLATLQCSQCGLCEMYSCFQGLSPRTLIGEYKNGLRKNGLSVPKGIKAEPVNNAREYRKVPVSRLVTKLGLQKYNVKALLEDTDVKCAEVKIKLNQHIGASASSVVSVGDIVTTGQIIGKAQNEKLGVNIHSSINGKVTEVNPDFIKVKA